MKRLTFLEGRFNLHVLMNHEKELAEMKKVPKRDYYNVRKVCFIKFELVYIVTLRLGSVRYKAEYVSIIG